MLNRVDIYLVNRSRAFVLVLSIMISLGLGVMDYLLGQEISFSIFYLLPIALSTWYAGRRVGLAVAVAASCIWLLADVLSAVGYSSSLIPVWNAMVRLGFFFITLSLIVEIRKRLDLEEMMADTDELTGLKNRRAFYEHVDLELSRSRRHDHSFTLAYIDLDNFKFMNDTFGHDAGDELLRAVASIIQSNLRGIDIVARLGGDEFACLFPETDYGQAESIIAKLLPLLRGGMEERGWPVTFSMGVSTFHDPPGSTRDLMNSVDALMYRVKREGKDNYIHEGKPG